MGILLYEAEQSARVAESKVKDVESMFAKEAIIDKEEFFHRLDLKSNEGRRSANNLVKRVGIVTYVDGNTFYVKQNGNLLFALSKDRMDKIVSTPYTPE
jgi:hypothetical protein